MLIQKGYICVEANHNKDYSVVKTFKPGRLGFFIYRGLYIKNSYCSLSIFLYNQQSSDRGK